MLTIEECKFIEYTLTIDGIENKEIDRHTLNRKIGSLCRITPCGDQYGDKTYMGIYLGDLPISILNSFNEETKILTNQTMNNPAIFVPELKKIIYGYESWWSMIENENKLKIISDKDIYNESSINKYQEITELRNYITQIEREFKDNPPLKFEKIKEGDWVWDRLHNDYFHVCTKKINDDGVKMLGNEYSYRKFEENRLYTREVKE